jgi:Protein of unknown function (DUF3987)
MTDTTISKKSNTVAKTFSIDDLEQLPAALAPLIKLPNWVVWRWVRKGDKWDKPPYRADKPKRLAKTNDPSSWSNYEDACRAVEKGKADGIGFNLLGTDINALDLDKCRDPETEAVAPWAQALIGQAEQVGAYVEVTVSGTGFRILGKGNSKREQHKVSLPEHGAGVAIEFFRNCERYITISGLQQGTCSALPNIDALFAATLAQYQRHKSNGNDPFSKFAYASESPTQKLNDLALANMKAWVPEIFPKARPYHGGYRVSSADLGRDLQEDLSIVPDGIKDWGVHDLDDPLDGKRTPVHLVMEHVFEVPIEEIARRENVAEFQQACDWLRERLPQQEPAAPVTVEPIDLWGHFEPPALPRELLPDVIERYAITVGELMGADPAGLAIGALTVCGGVIRDSIKLQVKRNSGWTEEARLWCALVGSVSTMKSPVMRAVARPVEWIESRLWREYQAAMAAYDALSAEERKEAKKPKLKQLRLEDTTIEGAQDTLRNNENGMLAMQDELSGWFGGMEKYNGGGRGAAKDRGFWLQTWNGGSYTVNRVTRGAFRVDNIGISMLGGIQPDVIREIASNTYDDGLIQRLLPIVLLPAKLGHDEPISPVADEYEQLIESLYAMTHDAVKRDPYTSFAQNLEGQAVLEFDNAAQVIRRELEQRHLELQKAFEVINKKLAAHVGKYNGYFARLCIVFHCIEHCGEVPGCINESTAQRVAKFLHEFLFPHALAFYADILNLSDDHDALTAIAGHILAHKLDQITNRDLARGDRKMKRLTQRDSEAMFEQLEALGWVTRTPGRRPTDPPRWDVNPRCHELFAEKAAEEAARRSEVRAIMARLPKRPKVPR